MARFTDHGLEQRYRLWDELADFPAAQSDAAMVHLLRTVSKWIKADDAAWVGGVRILDAALAERDLQHGWRGRAVRPLHPTPERSAQSRVAIRQQDRVPGLTTCAIMKRAGVFRAQRLHDGFVDLAAFKKTAHYREFYEQRGVRDRMWVHFPVNAASESCFFFDRVRSARRFSLDDLKVASHALRGIKWFHRQQLLSHGLLLAQEPLTDIQRRILHLLLTDKPEKEIAAAVSQSPATTHKYVTEILRKLNVRGRAGLMALWLGN